MNRGSPRASCLSRLAILELLVWKTLPWWASIPMHIHMPLYIHVNMLIHVHDTHIHMKMKNQYMIKYLFLDPALEQKVDTWSQWCHGNSCSDLRHLPHVEGCWQSLPPALLKSKFPLSSSSLTPSSPRLYSMYLSSTHFSLWSLCLKCGRLFALPHQRGKVRVNMESVCMPTPCSEFSSHRSSVHNSVFLSSLLSWIFKSALNSVHVNRWVKNAFSGMTSAFMCLGIIRMNYVKWPFW